MVLRCNAALPPAPRHSSITRNQPSSSKSALSRNVKTLPKKFRVIFTQELFVFTIFCGIIMNNYTQKDADSNGKQNFSFRLCFYILHVICSFFGAGNLIFPASLGQMQAVIFQPNFRFLIKWCRFASAKVLLQSWHPGNKDLQDLASRSIPFSDLFLHCFCT